jgi:2-amino-4-hydroxy-6-hydroxymethyldihydropteridine diphosphokinase
MSLCLIGLGSNLGEREATLERTLDRLARHPEIRVAGTSRFFETSPSGGPPGQGSFINAAAVLETALGPKAVLGVLLGIETSLGRQRGERWGPRTIDLDLLLYDDAVLETPALVVPHPRMAWRRFVLEPAAEVAGPMIHPTTGWTIDRLLAHLNSAKDYLAIAGPIGAEKTKLARELSQTSQTCWIADPTDSSQLLAIGSGSSGEIWGTALEFIRRQAELLAADAPAWGRPASLWVSDFWFDEWLAFASVCLPGERLSAFEDRWQAEARRVVRPKLTVMLDCDPSRLVERTRPRERPGEPHGTQETLARLSEAIRACLRRPDVGPVLTIVDESPGGALQEVLAAVEAMK